MATLQNIRNKSGLLLAVIGIAMLAFILGDLLKSTNSSGSGVYIGEILGEDISIKKFQQEVDEGIENWKVQNQGAVLNQLTMTQIRDQVWSKIVREIIMEKEFRSLGIDVSDDEFFELLQGVNVHPEISRVPSFQNPATGQFDRTRVLGYLKQIDQDQSGESRTRWINFQKYLINLIKNSKYNSLVEKSMYTTSVEAQNDFNSNNINTSFNYISIPFQSVNDTLIDISDKELRNFYTQNKNKFEQNASKDVDFVVYNITPSKEDDIKTRDEITELLNDFKNYEDYDLMVRRNSDNTNARFKFNTKNELIDLNWKNLFDKKNGSVYGPYLLPDGVYRIAKLVDIQYRSDSVKARHILLKPNQFVSLDSTVNRIDSLKSAIENGVDFGVIARKYSEDQGSAILGGDLGWFKEGEMVEEFNDFCFSSKKGDVSVVTTQFGVHLVEVTENSRIVKKVKIAYIDRNVEPSTETYNKYYSQAAQLVANIINDGTNFDTLVNRNNLIKRSDKKVTFDKSNISGLPNSREMVRWLAKADVNSVSEIFQFDNSYVVAFVTREYKEGYAKLEDVKEQVTASVIKEKKATKIIDKINNEIKLSEIASDNSTSVVNGKKANFSRLSIDGIGYEPNLVGSIFALDSGKISSPIIGLNGVYVVQIVSKDKEKLIDDVSEYKLKMTKQMNSYSTSSSFNALKEAAKVIDNRLEYY